MMRENRANEQCGKLIVLGSGGMVPTAERYPSGYLVECGGTRLLLDCGPLTLARLAEYGIDIHSIDAVAVTHFHTDHFAGLLPLVHARWVDSRLSGHEVVPLTVAGPATLKDRWAKLREVCWPEPQEEDHVKFIEAPHGTVQVGAIGVTAFRVEHVPWFSSLGYRINVGDRLVVYTGDVGSRHPFADLVEQCRQADVLLIEAGTMVKSANHFTVGQAVQLHTEAESRRTVLTHLRGEDLTVISESISTYNGIETARDGMEIEL